MKELREWGLLCGVLPKAAPETGIWLHGLFGWNSQEAQGGGWEKWDRERRNALCVNKQFTAEAARLDGSGESLKSHAAASLEFFREGGASTFILLFPFLFDWGLPPSKPIPLPFWVTPRERLQAPTVPEEALRQGRQERRVLGPELSASCELLASAVQVDACGPRASRVGAPGAILLGHSYIWDEALK